MGELCGVLFEVYLCDINVTLVVFVVGFDFELIIVRKRYVEL